MMFIPFCTEGEAVRDVALSVGALVERRRRAALWRADSACPAKFDAALEEGRNAERVRIGSILAAADGDADVAAVLAFETEMPTEQAVEALLAARRAEAAAALAGDAEQEG
jgi:hypothetical protein